MPDKPRDHDHNFVDLIEPGRTGRPYRHGGHRTCTICGLSDVYVFGSDYVSEFVEEVGDAKP